MDMVSDPYTHGIVPIPVPMISDPGKHTHVTIIFNLQIRWVGETGDNCNTGHVVTGDPTPRENDLKVLATIPYFIFYFFPHLVIFLQFRDSSYVLNLSTKAVLQKWHIWSKRAKYLQLELIFRRA